MMTWFDEFNLPGSTITGRFGFVREDGPDVGDAPDVHLASGTVRFRATAPAVRSGGAWVGITPVTAQIFDGEIVVSEEDPRPVRLLSTDADTGVEGWGWEASFDIRGASIKPIVFRAPATGVHLTGDDLIPITGLPVEVIANGALGRLTSVESDVTDQAGRLDALDGAVGQARADAQTADQELSDRIANHTHDDRYYIKVPTTVPLLNDTFSRTGPLAGSAADSGQVWQSTYTAWTTDGQKAVANALALASIPVPGVIYQAVFDLEVVTQTTVARSLTLAVGGFNDLWATVSLNAAGGCQVAVQKRFNEPGSVTIIPQFGVLSPNYPSPQGLTVTISILDGVVTVAADGITRTAEITATEQGMIDPTIGLVANNDITGIALTRIQALGGGRAADALAPLDHRHAITDVDGLREALDDIDPDVTIDDIPGLREALEASGDGESAYEVAVRHGYQGTEEQWLASLPGQDGSNVLPDREAVTGALGIHSANAYGAAPEASAATNRAAFQAAMDRAALVGGRVVAAPGTYMVDGLVQDSRVELYLPGVTLKHPTGAGSTPIVAARQRETTGAMTAGSRTLTVASTDGIEPGVMVAVRAAGGVLDTQHTTLTASVTASQTTGITLADAYGYLSAGWMLVGSEIITHTGISNGTLTGVVRGSMGTTAAAHESGAQIGLARRLYGEVVAVTGNTVTLDVPAVQSASGAAVTVGAYAPKITSARFDGNLPRPSTTFGPYPVSWGLVSHGTVTDHTVVNAESALMLTRGVRYARVHRVRAHDCGGPEQARGAALWLYEGCDRNRISDITVTGRTWVGVYLDDRTSTADEWAAPNSDNAIEDFVIAPIRPTGYPAAIDITGSVRNRVTGGSITDTSIGVKIDDGAGQVRGTVPDTGDNIVSSITMRKVDNPWTIKTSGNIVHDVIYRDSLATGSTPATSLAYAVTRAVNGPPVM